MTEGWLGDDGYFCAYDSSEESAAWQEKYLLNDWLPGFRLIGLWNWDDFVVQDSEGRLYLVPTTNTCTEYLEPFSFPTAPVELEMDSRVEGKVRWRIQPLAFGGDPEDESNIELVDFEKHAELVIWWNTLAAKIREGE